jgi:macrodomain Ter protein organizer (MatP/YcbG family)
MKKYINIKKMDTRTKEIVLSSPALKSLSELYPPNRRGKVPLKIKMACTVKSDRSLFFNNDPDIVAHVDQEYYVWCNSHGAMAAILPNHIKLGIKPSECDIIEWHT